MPGVLTNKLLQSTVETRIWQVDGGAHIVSVRNYTGGAVLEVYLDAELLHKASTARKRIRRKVALPDGRSGVVEVTLDPDLSYSFSLDGEEIPGDTDGLWDPASERRPDLDQCVSVPVARLGTASDGEGMAGVALYKVCLTPRATDDFAARAEWKRYNDFDELYTLAYSAYFYHQLASNVPKPPGKTMRRRTDDEFIESRRAALEHFLQQLLRVPRMSHNPDVLLFLGILDARSLRLGKTLGEATRPRRLLAELDGAGGELPAEVQALLELCCEDSPDKPPREAVEQLQQVSAQGGASLAPWLANTLEGSLPSGVEASKHVVVKTLSLLNGLLPKGSSEFKTAVKERCMLLLKQAEAYEEAGVADPLVQGLAQKTSALLLGV